MLKVRALRLHINFVFGGVLIMAASAQTPVRKVVATKADLPVFTYPVTESLQQLLTMPAADFTKFAAPLGRDIDNTLRDYEIEDHGGHRKLLQARLDLQVVAGEDAGALETIQQIRALEDKESAKLTSNVDVEAFVRARLADGHVAAGTCPAGYPAIYRAATMGLPWDAAGAGMKHQEALAGLASVPFFAGITESELGPMLVKDHTLTLDGAEFLLKARLALDVTVVCKQPTLEVATAYVKKNDVIKASIWDAREAVMPPAEKLTPVNVAIWDSGFDTSLFPGRLFVDAAADPRDRNGIAFDVYCRPTHGELIPLKPAEAKDYPDLVTLMQGNGDIEGDVDSPAARAFKDKLSGLSPQQMRSLYDEMGILGGYAHGTHVAGIAARGNAAVRLAYVRLTYDNGNPHMPPTEEMMKDLTNSYNASVQWMREHHIRVVNMSWWNRPSNYEKDLADNGVGKDDAERKQLARHYFDTESKGLYAALKSAPEILFVTIAGNSNANNAFEEDIPSSFRLPNLIVTGAVDQAGDETSFTSYGDNVLVDADGNAVESVVPGGTKVKMSGTSMAAPQVTNLAAKLLAIDPKLTPVQLIGLIRDGANTSEDKRKHLMNAKRSVELLEQGKLDSAKGGN